MNAFQLSSDGVHQCVDVNAGSCSRHAMHRSVPIGTLRVAQYT